MVKQGHIVSVVLAIAVLSSAGAVPVPQAPTGASISYGAWGAGYQADAPKGQHFTEVLGEFVVPRHAPHPPVAGVSWMGAWAGIGLNTSQSMKHDLMQDGIFEGMRPGEFGYSIMIPWWINEPLIPSTRPHVLHSLAIRPGDIVLSIVRQEGQSIWSFEVKDVTTGQQAFGICTSCYTDGRTVAWILEDPTSGFGPTLVRTNYAGPARLVFLKAEASLGHGLVPLGKLDWSSVLREVPGQVEKPITVPAKDGAFTIKRFDAPAGVLRAIKSERSAA